MRTWENCQLTRGITRWASRLVWCVFFAAGTVSCRKQTNNEINWPKPVIAFYMCTPMHLCMANYQLTEGITWWVYRWNWCVLFAACTLNCKEQTRSCLKEGNQIGLNIISLLKGQNPLRLKQNSFVFKKNHTVLDFTE